MRKDKKQQRDPGIELNSASDISVSGELRNEQDLEFYLKTIEELRKERDEFHDLLLRKQAEFDNYRKRVLKEKSEQQAAAQLEVIRELLPVIDACEKGLEAMRAEGDSASFAEGYRQGFELLLQQLKAVLEKFEVTEVPGVGSEFDPNVHEAVLREVTAGHREGSILDEYRKGYRLGDRLIRPSQVKVAVKP